MTAREDLAGLIDCALPEELPGLSAADVQAAADAVLEAGWRPQRCDSEDPRISEIRAAVADFEQHGTNGSRTPGQMLRDVLDILDRPAPALEPWQAEAHIREQRATALGYCEHVVEVYPDGEEDTCGDLRVRGQVHCAEHEPAPQVFFPGDTVPGGTWVMNESRTETRSIVGNPQHDWRVMFGPCVEIFGLPSPEEWQAAVDRARAEQKEADRG